MKKMISLDRITFDKTRFYFISALYTIGVLMIGIGIGQSIYGANAQTIGDKIDPIEATQEAQKAIMPFLNPVFDKIDPMSGLKVPEDSKAPKEYTQQQHDMTMLYGRLDYIVEQLNQLQGKCAKR